MTLPDLVEGALPLRVVDDASIRAGEIGAIYETTAVTLVERFGTSVTRVRLLRGLFALRSALRDVGATLGYQWIDGSFLDVPLDDHGRPREPGDIDVVTFCVESMITGHQSATPFRG